MGQGYPSLSVVIICKNEEANIRDCLESVKWADEIVVVDSGSTDRTLEIAREYTGRIIHHDWAGYGAQKEFALRQATGDWILSLDADERVSPELAEEIRSAIAGAADVAGFSMPRRTFYLGRWILHGGWYPDRKVRLVRRGAGAWTDSPLHERLRVRGRVGKLRGEILHYTYRDISDHLAVVDEFSTLAAEMMAASGRRRALAHAVLQSPWKFVNMYFLRLGFLDGIPGLILAVISSYYVFLKYAKLWELLHVKGRAR